MCRRCGKWVRLYKINDTHYLWLCVTHGVIDTDDLEGVLEYENAQRAAGDRILTAQFGTRPFPRVPDQQAPA
jgi:hypothetical protein